jgi:hypothetical protein
MKKFPYIGVPLPLFEHCGDGKSVQPVLWEAGFMGKKSLHSTIKMVLKAS